MIPPLDWKDGLQLTVGEAGDPEGKPFAHIVAPAALAFKAAILFSAAPDLLRELRSLSQSYDRLLKLHGQPFEWGTIASDAARAAIAKAVGGGR